MIPGVKKMMKSILIEYLMIRDKNDAYYKIFKR